MTSGKKLMLMTKRFVLDTLGVGIAGSATDETKMRCKLCENGEERRRAPSLFLVTNFP
jgi:hypothetical protein